jgi:hypothetical protein
LGDIIEEAKDAPKAKHVTASLTGGGEQQSMTVKVMFKPIVTGLMVTP